MDPIIRTERRVVIGLTLVMLGSGLAVALANPGLIRFWPFTIPEFIQLITPLFLVALFIERVLEVFLTTWRAAHSRSLEARAKDPESQVTEEQVASYKSRTQRMAFLSGTAIGIVVSAVGIRVLELFVDPAVFAALPDTQRAIFRVTDVLFTGAVLGGGSDGMHKLVTVFTNFLDSTAKMAKERGGGGGT